MSDDFCEFVPTADECRNAEPEPVKPDNGGGKQEADTGDKEIDSEMQSAMM